MARIWNTPVFVLATVYFVVDGVFSHVTRPITVWIAECAHRGLVLALSTLQAEYPRLIASTPDDAALRSDFSPNHGSVRGRWLE
jgi:hypothetical protein